MADWAIWAASAMGLLWALVHLFLGGRQVAAPLRSSDLPEVVRATAWMCWHMVTAVLFLLPVLAAWGALTAAPGSILAALVLNLGLVVAGVAAKVVLGVSWATLPQGLLFVPIVALLALALGG